MPLNRLLLLLTLTLASAGGGASQPATGKLLIQGSDLTAGDDLRLTAQNDIELLAAANTQQLRSSNKSSSASIGVSIGISSKGTASGPALTAGFSQAKGKANGDDLFWSNTHLTAGDTLTLTSGNDTTLRGATASGKQITADIGGDLKLESLQDTSTYDSKQKSAGISIAISPAGVPVGGGISGSGSKIASDYKSVTQQTALRAGDGGFDIQVGGNTDLKGAAITSTQTAVKEGKNTFNTAGDLTLSDLHNEATYDAKGGSVTLGTQLNEGKYTPQGTSAGYGEDEGHAESTTYAAITGYAGNSTARTGDPESGVSRIFDANKVQKEIDAQVKITQAFGQQASKAVGDYAKSKMEEAANLRALGKADEAKAIEDQWGKNGTLRLLAHTVIGGLTGGTPGALGSAAGTLTAPAVSDALKDAGITGPLADTITALASTAVGTAVGGTAGGGAALNEVANNFLSHQLQAKRAELRKKQLSGKISTEELLELRALDQADQRSDELLAKWKANPLSLDDKQKRQLAFYLDIYAVQEGPTKFYQLLGPNATQTGAFSDYGFPYAGTREAQEAYLKTHPVSVWQYLVGAGSDYNNENRSIYENAGSQLMLRGIHQAQADFANTVLLATVRPLTVAYGAYQLGYAGGAIYDGDYTTGITNVALGTLAIYGAYTLRAPVTGTEMTGVNKVVSGLVSSSEAQIALANSRGLHVDLFGGQRSQFGGAVNVDINAVTGVKADITQGLGFLADSSASNVTALNPFIPGRSGKFSLDILGEAGRVLEPGGELVVAATKGNSYVKLNQFPSAQELSSMGFDIVQYKVPLTNVHDYASRFGSVKFSQSGGQGYINPNDMTAIILRKKP